MGLRLVGLKLVGIKLVGLKLVGIRLVGPQTGGSNYDNGNKCTLLVVKTNGKRCILLCC